MRVVSAFPSGFTRNATYREALMISEEEVNAFASRTLRALREKSGLSHTAVGDEIGVSFQQVQKYEWNINRLSIGRCAQFAEFFSVPITTTGRPWKRPIPPTTAASSAKARSPASGMKSVIRPLI